MGVRVAYCIASMAIVSSVAACASNPYSEPRAAWRGEVENACLASGAVKPSAFVEPMSPLGGRGSCGLEHPFKISAALNGSVAVSPPAISRRSAFSLNVAMCCSPFGQTHSHSVIIPS